MAYEYDPDAAANETTGREIAENKWVTTALDDCGWIVRSRKYDKGGTRVEATPWGLACNGHRCRRIKCKHIWAVEFYMAQLGEEIMLPTEFEVEVPFINEKLQEDTCLQLVRFQTGWLIDNNDEEGLPLPEWDKKHRSEIEQLIGIIVERATDKKAQIFINVDHQRTPPESIGAKGLVHILTKKYHFRSVKKNGGSEQFMFDPDHTPDLYEGVPFAKELRLFINDIESTFMNGTDEITNFRLMCREFLDELRAKK